jgi:tRNA (mo5U34)-methyltransferase
VERARSRARELGVEMRQRTAAEAAHFVADAKFIWHQRFELAAGVFTPGPSDLSGVLGDLGLPDVRGLSILDVGTCNGGACFELERRGASRVVGVDIYDDEWFGFAAIREFLGSAAEYVQASVYGLESLLDEQFDVVLFLGVLYHLRHPLLALDSVRSVTRSYAVIETETCDADVGVLSSESLVRFFRGDELNADRSNWFAPTHRALIEWVSSCGFSVVHEHERARGRRAVVGVCPTSGDPEYFDGTYERPLRVVADQRFGRKSASIDAN